MEEECDIRMGEGERLRCNGCEWDGLFGRIKLRRDRDDEGERWKSEGYDRGDGVDDGRFSVNDEIVVMRGKGESGKVKKIRNRRQRLIIARAWKAGKEGH